MVRPFAGVTLSYVIVKIGSNRKFAVTIWFGTYEWFYAWNEIMFSLQIEQRTQRKLTLMESQVLPQMTRLRIRLATYFAQIFPIPRIRKWWTDWRRIRLEITPPWLAYIMLFGMAAYRFGTIHNQIAFFAINFETSIPIVCFAREKVLHLTAMIVQKFQRQKIRIADVAHVKRLQTKVTVFLIERALTLTMADDFLQSAEVNFAQRTLKAKFWIMRCCVAQKSVDVTKQ